MGIPGGWELIIVVGVVILLFGGKKIPELAKGLGKGIKDFKQAIKEDDTEEASLEITDKIVIKPTFRKYENDGSKLVIELDPKMSFGTGEHETTRLMLELLEKYVKGGEKVLDAGSGTGILAITAVKLGAIKAVAFDVDEWCYINGKENAVLNSVGDKIDFILGDISDVRENNFDLVLANINTHILNKIAKRLVEKTVDGGKLILSGLLRVDKELVTETYEKSGVSLIDAKKKNEWEALVFVK